MTKIIKIDNIDFDEKVNLIPTRINSKDSAKALMNIENIQMIIHTYKRSCLSKMKDEVFVCTIPIG